jgi:hypothetical protein
MRSFIRTFLIGVLLMVPVISGPGSVAAAEQSQSINNPFLSIGVINQDAIKFQVWTDQSSDHALKAGDRVVVHFKAEKPCFLVVVNVASSGDLTVIFPNRDKPDNAIQPGKEVTLFGEDSKLRLVIGKKVQETNLVFYVSPEPVSFVKIPDDQAVMRIPASAADQQKGFKEALEQIAGKSGFNRQVLAIKSEADGAADLRLMGGPKGGPWKDVSETPEPIAGTQGRSQDLKKE